jgi:hypothetical protein
MALPIDPDEVFNTWLESAEVQDIVDDAADLGEIVPYLKHALAAYQFVRRQRVKWFLRSLKNATDELSPKKKEAFDRMINSTAGAEVLADYTDKVVRTSSKTASAALAILYADVDDKLYSPEFKLSAAIALEGISEEAIDSFLLLSDVKIFVPSENQPEAPYPVVIANDKLISDLNESLQILIDKETRVALIQDLINRGLFLPDYGGARLGDGGVGITFGIGEISKRFLILLSKARSFLPEV